MKKFEEIFEMTIFIIVLIFIGIISIGILIAAFWYLGLATFNPDALIDKSEYKCIQIEEMKDEYYICTK